MTEKEIYKNLAERFIYSAEQHIINNVNKQEVVAFKAYHALESIASAYTRHFGRTVSRYHRQKLQDFLNLYNTQGLGTIPPRDIAQLVSEVESIRNNFLYPIKGATVLAPKDYIDLAYATHLSQRINGVITDINRHI
ncbi:MULTISPECIES: hypothetical protein [Bacillaceae]|uniref:hypothetical protein n=1 Tax=Bacillaceae TaxID=186817 RepID=UPI00065F7D14|nr:MULTISPECIES: hypothetical protein [Bacillaceae]MCF7622523.1 hypothetical protein [Peribacillus frigoritolerans]PRA80891.1 hypothetical protein CQ056_21145 [Peribacillus simplex]